MEFRQLRYFLAVAEERNFTRAAERCHIAQPPLSRQVAQLEMELGVQLFDRSQRQIDLTEAGRAFVEPARETLAWAERAMQAARQAAGVWSGQLRLGFLFQEHAQHERLAEALKTFETRYPKVSLVLTEQPTTSLIQALQQELLDLAFFHLPIEGEHFAAELVLQETFTVALPEVHSLARLSEVPLSALADEPILLPPRNLVPDKYDEIVGYCRRAGFEPRVVESPPNFAASLELVRRGIGFCLTPSGTTRPHQNLGVVFRPLKSPKILLNLMAVYKQSAVAPLLEAFLGVLKDALR